MLNMTWTNIFTSDELYQMRINAVTRFLQCDTPKAVEASIELARYLNQKGLDSQNYPLVLELSIPVNSARHSGGKLPPGRWCEPRSA